jgi:hypothetical protein
MSISNKGSSDVQAHINVPKLKKQIQACCKTPKVSEFFMKQNSRQKKKTEKQVTATEATLSLQITKFHFPKRSIDCTSKLNKVVSSDSEIARRVSCEEQKLKTP